MVKRAVRALAEVIGESAVTSVLIGVGAALIAPVVIHQIRPLTKRLVKEGLKISDKAKELVAEAREQWSDLLAEARAELVVPPAAAEGAESPAPSPPEAAA